MRVLDDIQAAQELARALGKPILLLSGLDWFGISLDELPAAEGATWKETGGPLFVDAEGTERLLAAPYFGTQFPGATAEALPIPDTYDCLIVCEDRAEMERLYDLTYGDDGMTKRGIAARGIAGYPEYRGPHRVYALTINERGELMSENT